MTQPQLFIFLLVTALFCIGAVREISRDHFAMGALLLAVPFCGWLSILVKL
jgi:hypothetical protein